MNEEINVHLEMINYLTAMFNVATGAFISSLKSDEIIVGNMRVFIHDSKIADEVSENKDIAYAIETVESAEKAFNYMKESYSSAEDSLELHRVETLARINNVIGDLKENIDSKKKEIVRINSFQEDLLKSSHEISLNHNILKDEINQFNDDIDEIIDKSNERKKKLFMSMGEEKFFLDQAEMLRESFFYKSK